MTDILTRLAALTAKKAKKAHAMALTREVPKEEQQIGRYSKKRPKGR